MAMAKLGIMQVKADYDMSVERCLDHMLFLAEKCLEKGADLVFMPEFYQYKSVSKDLAKAAADYSEQYLKKCSQLAKKYKAYVVPWDMENADDGLYNTCYVLDRQGNEIGKFRKVHLTYDEQQRGVVNGTDFPVFDLDFGRIGIMICFDNYFPESARCLAFRGARLILYPLYGDTLKQWDIKLRARAIDNSVYIAPCAIQGSLGQVAFSGLVDPEGNTLCRLEEEGSYAIVEFDPDKTVYTNTMCRPGMKEDIKEYLLKVRTPEAYGPIMEKSGGKDWGEIFTPEQEEGKR